MITRKDFEAISQWIKPNASVLDLGCGDGALLVYLDESRHITGYGIENDNADFLQSRFEVRLDDVDAVVDTLQDAGVVVLNAVAGDMARFVEINQ